MSGLTTRVHLDPNGQDLAIEHIQSCDEILDWNKEARRDEQHSDFARHVARIPNVLYVKWLDEAHAKGHTDLRPFTPEFDAIVQKKLNDPEYMHLRTDKPALIVGWMGFGS